MQMFASPAAREKQLSAGLTATCSSTAGNSWKLLLKGVQLSLAAEAIGWLRARRYPTWFRFLQPRSNKKIGKFEQYTVRQRVAKRYHAFGLANSCQV
jgi:hypothetical protein